MTQLLLTSFQTWQAHQTSNSSDDLLGLIGDRPAFAPHHYLRHLPVDTAIASRMVCAQIDQLQPTGVLCCGMAETRSRLSLEVRAREPGGERIYTTAIPLSQFLAQLPHTTLSEDAGQFVCEGLYFYVLQHLETCSWPCWG
ncbi:MAG: peptidase C15, partial [Spirulina sp. SIO3F2]|nr:peptidase C15 [Spirulina sp. SIO3F2]